MSFDIGSLDVLVNAVKIQPKARKDIIDAVAYVALELVKDHMTFGGTGKYFQSWKILKKSEKHCIVGTRDRELYLFLEFGTKPHYIVPRNKNALYFDGNFYAEVHHTGSRRYPHLEPAFAKLKVAIPKIIAAKVALNSKVFQEKIKDLYPEKKYTSRNTRGGASNASARKPTGLRR